MSGLDIVVAHYDGVVSEIGSNPGIDMRDIGRDIVEIISGIVALQVVAYVDEHEIDTRLTELLYVGRDIGQRSLRGRIVDIKSVNICSYLRLTTL